MTTTKVYGPTDEVSGEIPAGYERISLVKDYQSGDCFYQVERSEDDFYLCDSDGDKVQLGGWTVVRILADVPADDSDAFFEAIACAAKRVGTD